VLVEYPSGIVKSYDLTPKRKKPVVSLSRRHYRAAAKGFITTEHLSDHVVESLTQQVRHEMTTICSEQHNSILRDSHEGVKRFSWESIWLEFQANVPTLYKLLKGFVPKADDRFISFVISLLLKKCCKHMSLVQRVISTLLYGHSAKKQVSIH